MFKPIGLFNILGLFYKRICMLQLELLNSMDLAPMYTASLIQWSIDD